MLSRDRLTGEVINFDAVISRQMVRFEATAGWVPSKRENEAASLTRLLVLIVGVWLADS